MLRCNEPVHGLLTVLAVRIGLNGSFLLLLPSAGGCFGAVVVKNGKIVGEGYNNVISRNDPTW